MIGRALLTASRRERFRGRRARTCRFSRPTANGSDPSQLGAGLFAAPFDYRNRRQFLAVEISSEPDFRPSAPKRLHEVPFDHGYPLFPDYYDVAPNGRFLVVEDRSTKRFNVIFNWFDELERLAPTE